MTVVVQPEATASIAGQDHKPEGGTLSLDEMQTPYADATLELPYTDDAAAVDVFGDTRVVLNLRDEVSGDTRTADLSVAEVEVVHQIPKRIIIRASSDEMLLQQYAPLTTDTGARAHEASLRGVVSYVLGKIGATLAAGGPDRNVRAMWDMTNQIANPDGRINTDGWAAYTREGAADAVLGWVERAESETAGWMVRGRPLEFSNGDWLQLRTSSFRATVGERASAIADMRFTFFDDDGFPGEVRAGFDFYDANDRLIRTVFGPTYTVNTGQLKRVDVSATVPRGTVEVRVFFRANRTNDVLSSIQDTDYVSVRGATLVDGEAPPEPFNGWTPDNLDYLYEWEDEPHKSPSTRTALYPRDPDTFVWEAGVSAWEFLAPLVASVGLRLYCDERRVWRLIDPNSYAVPGSVDLSGATAIERTDTTRREDKPTGVVVVYKWKDRQGFDREQRDTTGAAGRVDTVVFENKAWPGKGLAASILASRSNRGRSQVVRAAVDYLATPRMAATGADVEPGNVEAVTWTLGEGLMTVTRHGGTSS